MVLGGDGGGGGGGGEGEGKGRIHLVRFFFSCCWYGIRSSFQPFNTVCSFTAMQSLVTNPRSTRYCLVSEKRFEKLHWEMGGKGARVHTGFFP